MRTPTQLKAKIRNLATITKIGHEILLRTYFMERFLTRVSLSNYHENFILKGGMLVSAMVGIEGRATLDLDATITGVSISKDNLVAMINEIVATEADDYVRFEFSSIEDIHDGAEYPGYRVSIHGVLDRTRQMVKIDFTTGDPLTPRAIEFMYPLLFDDVQVTILSYNTETLLAEKMETILSRSVFNTRMRDFYDVYIVSKTRLIDRNTFKVALIRTSEKRGTLQIIKNFPEILKEIESSTGLQSRWERYQKEWEYASNINWSDLIMSIQTLVETVSFDGNEPYFGHETTL